MLKSTPKQLRWFFPMKYISIILNEADSKNKISTEEQEEKLLQILKKLSIDVNKSLSLRYFNSSSQRLLFQGKLFLKKLDYKLQLSNAAVASAFLSEGENARLSNVQIKRFSFSNPDSIKNHIYSQLFKEGLREAKSIAEIVQERIGNPKLIKISQSPSQLTLNDYQNGNTTAVVLRVLGRVADEDKGIDFQKIKIISNLH